jgi:hypothetical protein
MKSSLKFGRASTGAVDIADFNCSNAAVAVSVHTKASFFNKSVRGLAIEA